MRLRIKQDIPLGAVLERVARLQAYRFENRIVGRLDERVGRPLDGDEHAVVEVLLSEGRNVTSLAVKRTGAATPDIAVDAVLAEIKTSTKANAANFAQRLADVWSEQGAAHIYVNAIRSQIPADALLSAMELVVAENRAKYIRVIGRDYDEMFGRW